MVANTRSYNGFAVAELHRAREWYGGTLGLRTSHEYEPRWRHLTGGRDTLVYEQPGVSPPCYTILNFEVADIDQGVDDRFARGVRFVRYDGLDQDSNGICRNDGAYIAWFNDPSGNVLSVLQKR